MPGPDINPSFTNPRLLGRASAFQAQILEGPNGLQVIQDAVGEYGIGITLPLTPDEHSPYGMKLAYSTAQAVQSDLINLLLTQKGERLDNPNFGSNLNKFLFRQNTADLEPLLEDEIRGAFKEYENDTGIGVDIVEILVERKNEDGSDSHGITIKIKYKVLGSVQEILTTLMNRPDGPIFSSYQTTSDQLWNMGTPANGSDPIQINSGYDDDEFIV